MICTGSSSLKQYLDSLYDYLSKVLPHVGIPSTSSSSSVTSHHTNKILAVTVLTVTHYLGPRVTGFPMLCKMCSWLNCPSTHVLKLFTFTEMSQSTATSHPWVRDSFSLNHYTDTEVSSQFNSCPSQSVLHQGKAVCHSCYGGGIMVRQFRFLDNYCFPQKSRSFERYKGR